MWAATAWNDEDFIGDWREYDDEDWDDEVWTHYGWDGTKTRSWSVLGRFREREWHRRKKAADERRRFRGAPEGVDALASATTQNSGRAYWRGKPTVLAFIFAHPDSDAIRLLDARGEYFDLRTGDTWDLFFPGYYRPSARMPYGSSDRDPIRRYTDGWRFNPAAFNELRRTVESQSHQRWVYSGETDLVLISGWEDNGCLGLDWDSTIGGQITDQVAGAKTLTLASVIERITRDLETAAEDASYGVSEVTDGPSRPESHIARDLMINTLSGIAAALGTRALGI